MCRKKLKLRTKVDALQAIRKLSHLYGDQPYMWNHYWCDECECLHVGHTSKYKRKPAYVALIQGRLSIVSDPMKEVCK